MIRKSMRPLTLKRLIEVCNLALINEIIEEYIIVQELKTSKNRAKELLLELENMKLLTKIKGGYMVNKNTHKIIGSFEKEDWQAFHDYFFKNSSFYRQFIVLLISYINDEKGISINEMIDKAKTQNLTLNRTSIEVLQNWCERLGILQRNLYTKRFYLLKKDELKPKYFKDTLIRIYRDLNISRGLGLKLIYVEIPKLREEVCEKLKITRERFDTFFKKLYRESIGRIELSGAPTITSAKRSPLSIRVIKASKKDNILSPYLDLKKERRGIEIGGKSYYYVAIHL